MADPSAHHEPSARQTDRAVVIVDPFPKPPAFDPELSGQELQEQVWLRAVLRSLVPALRNQLRVKAIDLARAGKADVYSRFLIAPSRQIYRVIGRVRVPVETADDLASGVFGAFGGFLSTKFAEHDYQLGRRNCQQFLRTRFALPADNDVVKAWPEKAAKKFGFSRHGRHYRPVIPLCGSASIEVEPHEWPRVGNDVIEEFLRHVRRRGDALVDKIAREELKRWVFRLAARFGWRIYKSDVLNTIRLTLTADLIRRDQHEEWAQLEIDLDRLIIAALYEPAYHAQSPERIARSINRRSHGRKDMQTTTADDVKSRLNGALASYVVTLSHSGGDAFRLRSHWRKPPRFFGLA